jgi:hypothetical protein
MSTPKIAEKSERKTMVPVTTEEAKMATIKAPVVGHLRNRGTGDPSMAARIRTNVSSMSLIRVFLHFISFPRRTALGEPPRKKEQAVIHRWPHARTPAPHTSAKERGPAAIFDSPVLENGGKQHLLCF